MKDPQRLPRDDSSGDETIRALLRLSREQVAEHVDAIAALARHPAPEVRAEAIGTLFVRGKRSELRHIATRALSRDGDEGVRAAAALGLAAVTSQTTLKGDSELLLRALRNDLEAPEVRRCAYEALLIIHGRSDFPNSLADFEADRDVDWLWVELLESSLDD